MAMNVTNSDGEPYTLYTTEDWDFEEIDEGAYPLYDGAWNADVTSPVLKVRYFKDGIEYGCITQNFYSVYDVAEMVESLSKRLGLVVEYVLIAPIYTFFQMIPFDNRVGE